MTTPLVTLEEVRSYMAIRSDVEMPDVDNRINSQIVLATKMIETALSVEFDYKQRIEYFGTAAARRFTYDFDAPSASEYGVRANPTAQSFLLKAPPVDLSQPVVVCYDPSRQFTLPTTQLADGAVALDDVRGKLTVRLMSAARERALQVTYFGGYALDEATGTLTTSAPADLKMACIIQTIYLFARIQPDNIGMQTDRGQGKLAQGTFMTRGGITPEATAMLWEYKRLNTGRY
jgi:hypothetical protein